LPINKPSIHSKKRNFMRKPQEKNERPAQCSEFG